MFKLLILLIAALWVLVGYIAYLFRFSKDEDLPAWPFAAFLVVAVAVSVMTVLRNNGYI
jgi:hypothetical protein